MTAFTSAIERELGGDLVANLNAEGVAFRRKGQRKGLSLRVPWADIEALSRGVIPGGASPSAPGGGDDSGPVGEWHCPKCGFANDLGPGPWTCPDCNAANEVTLLVEGPPRLQLTLPGSVAPDLAPSPQPPLQNLPAEQIAAPAPEGRKRRSKCPRCGEYGFFVKGHAHKREDGSLCSMV